MQEIDARGDKVGDWAVRENNRRAKCNWCKITFGFDSQGIGVFKSQAKTKMHTATSNGRKGRLQNQRSVLVNSASERENAEEDMEEEDEEDAA